MCTSGVDKINRLHPGPPGVLGRLSFATNVMSPQSLSRSPSYRVPCTVSCVQYSNRPLGLVKSYVE